ncbi:response regulator transcription factor [Vibrio sp. SCSIO 43135]|uniref:response regulator transcription factor n=1 Tax=Vibrio sp. SCSIO 43135 TaxID=2819096 RepID=UPI0020763430|nr:response regulator transcription factor [Vibrio sp. SCSIO 43135]USD43606.1 response regulator transcription factor [Vibrio sp. SCSIO 43135]
MNSNHILIIDTFPIVRRALELELRTAVPSAHFYHTDSCQEAAKILRANEIDMILLDVDLNDGSGLNLVSRIRRQGFAGKILFISSSSFPKVSQTAKDVGANGYISKTEPSNLIRDAIMAVRSGYSVFKQEPASTATFQDLSKRESIVLNYLSKGYSNKKISELLSLSSKTVSTYKRRILKKYDANSIIEVMNLEEMASGSALHS